VVEKARLSEAADTLVVMRDFDPYAEHFVDGPYKGLGEAYTLFQFATALHHQGVPFKQWFKVSGRYWLKPEFDFGEVRNERQFVFSRGTDGNPTTTFFYSVPRVLNHRFIGQMVRMLAGEEEEDRAEPVMEQMIDQSVSPACM
jgi:hypothetical protein